MEWTGDDLAGVVDMFGGLSREDLAAALVELAFKQGVDVEPSAFEEDIDSALQEYELVELEPGTDETLLVAGPAAFPRLPEEAADLHHILDADQREVDREEAGTAAADKLHRDAVGAIDAGDRTEIQRLIDLSYDIEAWAPVDLSETRHRLDDELSPE
ncbi:MAG: DUF7109 family protein [Halovenus sp.]